MWGSGSHDPGSNPGGTTITITRNKIITMLYHRRIWQWVALALYLNVMAV
tara:strand:- start:1297 stop:1446 length:150 start_codon:yes stop_codon:yes gene_type:complete